MTAGIDTTGRLQPGSVEVQSGSRNLPLKDGPAHHSIGRLRKEAADVPNLEVGTDVCSVSLAVALLWELL